MPTFGSLFAGIGGIDLGLERAGWTVRWQVEWEPFCQRVLARHWPEVPQYGDITAVDWSQVEPVDLIAGGFPCQPVSTAGKRLAQADERWLWPEFARAVRDLRPRLVLVENVPGLLARGMGDVLGDLAALGYDAEWSSLSAAEVGAPHLRERIFVLAHADRDRRSTRRLHLRRQRPDTDAATVPVGTGEGIGGPTAQLADSGGRRCRTHLNDLCAGQPDAHGCCAAVADAACFGTGEPPGAPDAFTGGRHARALARGGGWWAVEPAVGRVADGLPPGLARWRNAALKSLGNAVVPQVAEVLGWRLRELMP